MQSRFFLSLVAGLSLSCVGACDDSGTETTADGGKHGEHDAGQAGHDGGHASHGDAGGSCAHAGLMGIACVGPQDTVGASAESDSGTYSVEVTSLEPGDLIAGADESFELMVKITDDTGAGVDDASLSRVYTQAHGGHNSCGSPSAESKGDGMYHVHGLTYPHEATWYHEFSVGEETLTLPLCVLPPE